jgi:hypothetical protein
MHGTGTGVRTYRAPVEHRSRGGRPADPDFLYAALNTPACAAFIKESRMKSATANQLHRNFGHYCGEAHAQVYISRWFESVCSPPKSTFR